MLLLNNRDIDYFKFPGGELQVKLPVSYNRERVIITWKPKNSDAIMKLLLTVNALHNDGVTDIDLDILYLPYGRQDRVCSPREALSIEVIVGLLNNLDLKTIRIWDPHSRASYKDLKTNHHIINVEDILSSYRLLDRFAYRLLDQFDWRKTILCAPDFGASTRIGKIHHPNYFIDKIYCSKTRDVRTGEILAMNVPPFAKGSDILVIDDICDGGATFMELAKKLHFQGAGKKFLYVTHGIFSKGLDALLHVYDHIYCHHVLDDKKYQSFDRLTILKEHPVEN